MQHHIIALVPARSGSKGIIDKNIRPLAGNPLVYYTIKAARESKYLEYVLFSSDSGKYIDIARQWIDVDYVRPATWATDEASSVDMAIDALLWYEDNYGKPDAFVLLQPTSPLRTSGDIDGAIEDFVNNGLKSLVSVHKPMEHPADYIDGDGNRVFPPKTRRQEYPTYYWINGAIYINDYDFFMKHKAFYVKGKTDIYIMSREHGHDIDTEDDLKIAEYYLTR